ncbi:MAG: hypothetical protein AB1Z98_25230 [Nannocystaceae bacterium]
MSDDDQWNWEGRYTDPSPDADLAQGDLIDTQRSGVADRFSRSRWFVVLNQSCDLARQQRFEKTPLMVPRARTLLVAPAVPLTEYFATTIANGKSLAKSSKFERLLWWNDDWAVYLPPGPGVENDLVVVLEELYTLEAWRNADGLPDIRGYDEAQRARVLGLASPWAERLGWVVGRQFARVGTPDPPSARRAELVAAVADRVASREH